MRTYILNTTCSLELLLKSCILCVGNKTHLYRAQDKQKCIHVTLLYSDNGSGLNSADKIKSMSSVGATQITLTQDGKHHLLALHVDVAGLESLWKVVSGDGSGSAAIQAGLLAARLEGGVTMWLSNSGSSGSLKQGGETAASSQPQQSKQEKSGNSGEWGGGEDKCGGHCRLPLSLL